MKSLADLLSTSIVLFYVIPLVAYFITKQSEHLRVFGGFVGTNVLSELIKHYLVGDAGPRPSGARDCNLWCNNGNQAGRPGMPSTHSATATFLAIMYGGSTAPLWQRIGIWTYAIAVMVARWYKQCHTIAQIGAGAVLGAFMACAFDGGLKKGH